MKTIDLHKTRHLLTFTCIISLILVSLASCSRNEGETRQGNADPVEIPAGAVLITSEEELKEFLNDEQESYGYIRNPITLTDTVEVVRSRITLEAGPGAMISLAFPSDDDFLWPVTQTDEAFVIKGDDVTFKGFPIVSRTTDYKAYNIITVDGTAENFTFDSGNITGYAVKDESGRISDYTVATGIDIKQGAKNVTVSNSIVSDAITALRISSGSTHLKNLIFNSDISVKYEYGAEPDFEMSGCTSLPEGKVSDGGTVTIHKGPYGNTISKPLLESMRKENATVTFIEK